MAQRTVQAKQGQTIMDMALQEYGDANFFHDILDLNGFSPDHNLVPGESVIVDTDNVGNKNVKDYFARVGVNGKKRYVPANYIEYLASDFSPSHFLSGDFS